MRAKRKRKDSEEEADFLPEVSANGKPAWYVLDREPESHHEISGAGVIQRLLCAIDKYTSLNLCNWSVMYLQ